MENIYIKYLEYILKDILENPNAKNNYVNLFINKNKYLWDPFNSIYKTDCTSFICNVLKDLFNYNKKLQCSLHYLNMINYAKPMKNLYNKKSTLYADDFYDYILKHTNYITKLNFLKKGYIGCKKKYTKYCTGHVIIFWKKINNNSYLILDSSYKYDGISLNKINLNQLKKYLFFNPNS